MKQNKYKKVINNSQVYSWFHLFFAGDQPCILCRHGWVQPGQLSSDHDPDLSSAWLVFQHFSAAIGSSADHEPCWNQTKSKSSSFRNLWSEFKRHIMLWCHKCSRNITGPAISLNTVAKPNFWLPGANISFKHNRSTQTEANFTVASNPVAAKFM